MGTTAAVVAIESSLGPDPVEPASKRKSQEKPLTSADKVTMLLVQGADRFVTLSTE
jgi:hypothetical protein